MNKFTCLIIIMILPVLINADDLAVTVYNSNIGVISETRTMTFEKGLGEIKVVDIPSSIDRTSVRFDITGKYNVTILEQNYQYDLIGEANLYRRFLNQEIKLVTKSGDIYIGTLLSSSSQSYIIMDNAGMVKVIRANEIITAEFPSLPEGLITKPQLKWKYQSDKSGEVEGVLSYQTRNMKWDAEYVAIVNQDDTKLDLSGWASINNNSGKTYKDAKLKLIAGDINRAEPPQIQRYDKLVTASIESSQSFKEKSFFEYHLYTLPRKVTLADKENKQISLFEPSTAGIEKVYLFRPERNSTKVAVAFKFNNSQSNGLGQPLPAGKVRVFKADDDKSLILLGEDRISHTPKNEDVKLNIGFAFDIIAKEELKNQTRVTDKIDQREFSITLSNRKETAVTVEVEKKLYGFWEIVSSEFEFVKKDAATITFEVDIAPDETKTVTYKVLFTHR